MYVVQCMYCLLSLAHDERENMIDSLDGVEVTLFDDCVDAHNVILQSCKVSCIEV